MIYDFNKLRSTAGRILAVDFGDTRTGLALSDASRMLASGRGYVSPGGLENTAAAVAKYAHENRAVAVIVGLPKNMDGSEGKRAERTREFARRLSELLNTQCGDETKASQADKIPVVLVDERLTTMAAARYLNETDTTGKKRKAVIDSLSAEILLQNTLDKLKYNPI